MPSVHNIIKQVLEGECSARCMDDEEDREATITALVRALRPMTAMKESDDIQTWSFRRGYLYHGFLRDPDGSGEYYADVVVDPKTGHWILWRNRDDGCMYTFRHDENVGDVPVQITELPDSI